MRKINQIDGFTRKIMMEPKKANLAIILTAVIALVMILLCLSLLMDWIPFSQKNIATSTSSENTTVVVVPSAPSPSPSVKRPSVEDLSGCSDKLQFPKEGSYLKNYETYAVQPESGQKTFLLYKPEKLKYTSDRIMDLEKDTVVTAIAKENGYTLVLVKDGVAGWVVTQELETH